MNRHILLVDDDFRVLQGFGRILHRIFSIDLARGGEEGLQLMQEKGPYAAVVSDYQMPNMNGIEFLSRVKSLAPDTIRLMLTGQADITVAISAINEGDVFKFLTKPCSNEDLIDALNEAVEQYNFITSHRLESSEKTRVDEIKRIMNQSMLTAQQMLEEKDSYTARHQIRVAQLATAIGRYMNLEPAEVEMLEVAAKVHDIGKFFIPSEILSRNGKVNSVEISIIQTHSRNGYEILRLLDFYHPVADIVLQHHERMDGSGYPLGLKNTDICLEARIIAVADVVEAMTSPRPYRHSFSIELALHEIQSKRGLRYDSEVVDACVILFKDHGFRFT